MHAAKIHLYLVDKDRASVEGYGIDGDITKPAVLLWNVHFASTSQVIEAIAPSHHLSAGLPVVMRGDNSVTPKYINTNLLAVRTCRGDGVWLALAPLPTALSIS